MDPKLQLITLELHLVALDPLLFSNVVITLGGKNHNYVHFEFKSRAV